jgi:predicted nuclease of predicted toxin-antitoxin system
VRSGRLRFLTDENVSPRLIAFLREQGHDVQDVKEEGWQGRDDIFLLRRAWATQRVVISYDRDFGKLAIARQEPCYGVIYIRLRDQRAPNAVAVMRQFLKRRIAIRPGSLVVLQESRARIRLVPLTSDPGLIL